MKRIVIIILILVNLYVIGLLLLRALETKPKEHFQSRNVLSNRTSLNENSGTTTSSTVVTPLEVEGGSITLYNVNNLFEKFYEVSGTDLENCVNGNNCLVDEDCSSNQECLDLFNEGASKCYNFIEQPSFELESENNSYISLENTDTQNFSFEFGVVLKNADTRKTILSTRNNLWSIYNENKAIYLGITDMLNPESGQDRIKLSTLQIQCYKFYKIQINLTQRKIVVNFNEQPSSTEAFFKLTECTTNLECHNGECNRGRCVYLTDEYHFGKSENDYFDMFIGSIRIIQNTSESNQESQSSNSNECRFHGADFKNKQLCLETCYSEGCEDYYCEDECNNVPVCEFETIGRHSIDCVQECIKNNDCTSEFCIEKCENCAPNCPWNKKMNSYDDFDSQYFDPLGKPSPLKLTLNTISTDGTKVSVRWRTPFEGKSPIKGYMSYLYRTFNKSEGVKINKISLKNCNVVCEYIIKDLIPNETYTLGIKSYNDIGLSRTSNLLTFKASITNINMDLRIEEDVSDNDLGDFNYCNVPN